MVRARPAEHNHLRPCPPLPARDRVESELLGAALPASVGLKASERPIRCSRAEPSHLIKRWRSDASAPKGARGCRKTPPLQNPMLLTIKELSRQLNIKQSTLYLWAKQGKIPCQKIHSLIRFDAEVIAVWLRSFNPHQPTAAPSRPRDPDLDLDRIIEAAKQQVYTPGHGETITPSPTRKE